MKDGETEVASDFGGNASPGVSNVLPNAPTPFPSPASLKSLSPATPAPDKLEASLPDEVRPEAPPASTVSTLDASQYWLTLGKSPMMKGIGVPQVKQALWDMLKGSTTGNQEQLADRLLSLCQAYVDRAKTESTGQPYPFAKPNPFAKRSAPGDAEGGVCDGCSLNAEAPKAAKAPKI